MDSSKYPERGLSDTASSYAADDDGLEEAGSKAKSRARRRQATVYDAVAGRITTLRDGPEWNTDDEDPDARVQPPRATRHPTRNTTLAPEEVLFQRKEAPLRWPHHDIYMAHERDLPDAGQDVLPSSDLLKAVHSFASHYYHDLALRADAEGRHGTHLVAGRNINEASMDETALLALGILLEEAGKEVLGKRGDLVFAEGEEIREEPRGDELDERDDGSGSEGLSELQLDSDPGSDGGAASGRRKRRRVDDSGGD